MKKVLLPACMALLLCGVAWSAENGKGPLLFKEAYFGQTEREILQSVPGVEKPGEEGYLIRPDVEFGGTSWTMFYWFFAGDTLDRVSLSVRTEDGIALLVPVMKALGAEDYLCTMVQSKDTELDVVAELHVKSPEDAFKALQAAMMSALKTGSVELTYVRGDIYEHYVRQSDSTRHLLRIMPEDGRRVVLEINGAKGQVSVYFSCPRMSDQAR